MRKIADSASRRRGGGTVLGLLLPDRLPDPSIGKFPGDPGTQTVTNASGLVTAVNAASNGGVIYCRDTGGTYGTVTLQNKIFSALNPITILNYPGENPVFGGRTGSQSVSGHAVFLGGCIGMRLRGLTHSAPNDNGLAIDACVDIEIDQSVFSGNGVSNIGNGILVRGTVGGFARNYNQRIQLWNSEITNNGNAASHNSVAIDHGIYWGGKGTVTTAPIGVTDWVIANCLIHDQPGGFSAQIGNAAHNGIMTNCTIVGNTNANAAAAGIGVWRGETSDPDRNNLYINNIIALINRYGMNGSIGAADSTSHARNNLLYSNGAGAYSTTTGTFVVDNTASTQNPQFVNVAGQIYTLQTGSPADGLADPDYCPTHDILGNERKTSPTLGCYELLS